MNNDLTTAAQILGSKGGRANTDKQTQARRENGKKGGRPPKLTATIRAGDSTRGYYTGKAEICGRRWKLTGEYYPGEANIIRSVIKQLAGLGIGHHNLSAWTSANDEIPARVDIQRG